MVSQIEGAEVEVTGTATNPHVRISGELDLAGADAREAEVRRLAAEPAVRTVVLDLRALEFLDSSGLRVVARSQRRRDEAGRRLALVRGPETVQRVFDISRMTERLHFVDAPEELR